MPMLFIISKPEESLLCKRIKSKEKTGPWLIEMVLKELDFRLVVANKIGLESRNIGFNSLLIK